MLKIYRWGTQVGGHQGGKRPAHRGKVGERQQGGRKELRRGGENMRNLTGEIEE